MEQSRESIEKHKKRQNKNYDKKPNSGISAGLKNYDDFNQVSPSRFYTEKEEITLRFYQTPKALFKNPKYLGLSLGAKLMYSVLRDRLDISIKNEWKDEHSYIYLIFSIEELSDLLEIERKTVMRHKQELVQYKLIIDRRLGQGKPNRIYILKPELGEENSQKSQKRTSRNPNNGLLDIPNMDSIDTYVNKTNKLNNVKSNAVFNNNKKEKRSEEKEYLAQEMAEQLNDDHSLGFYRKIADMVPETLIFQALSEVKDASLTGRVKKSKAALFTTVIQGKALEYNINLDIKKTGI
ncbi:MAG: replication initiator protein A [Candidatus Humimicrobiaceae bacterium]